MIPIIQLTLPRLNIHSAAKVCCFLVWLGITSQLVTTGITLPPMDKGSREAFLAEVEAEEDWLEGISRRLSTGSPLPHTTASNDSSSPLSGGPQHQGGGPVRRSCRKRKLTAELGEARRHRMSNGSQSTTPDLTVMEQLRELMKEMREVRDDVNRAENGTATKIDSLSKRVTDRMNKTELSVKCLTQDVAAVKADLAKVKRSSAVEKARLETMIERTVERRMEGARATSTPAPMRRPRAAVLTGANLQPIERETKKEENYLRARRSLKLWPVVGEDLKEAVVRFCEDRLRATTGRVAPEDLVVTPLLSPVDSPAQNQVLVEFSNVRLRDEVRNLAKNLAGSREAGIQIEVPDHLRGRYQTFQSLAYELKKTHPALKRNIKFVDHSMELVKDVKLAEDKDWKAVQYEDANAILPARSRTASMSRTELAGLVGPKDKQTAENDSSSDMDDDTFIDLTGKDDNKKADKCSRSLCFINTNARSLGPKIESLFDCMHEKNADIAMITETWFQSNRINDEELVDYAARFSLGVISRNRNEVANNGRQYGGVALFYRLATSSFKPFELNNPLGHEVLAGVGTIKGIKGKVVCIAAYAPPNLTLLAARQLNEYMSDLIGEAKRSHPECSIILAGDFNHWPVEEAVEDHTDFTEVPHGNTRGHRAIDRSFVNFSSSVIEASTLPPLETEVGQPSDHRIAYAVAKFEYPKPDTITYTYRHYTEQGAAKFAEMIVFQSWVTVFAAVGSSAKVQEFQLLLESLLSACFVTKTTTRRKSDPPWVND